MNFKFILVLFVVVCGWSSDVRGGESLFDLVGRKSVETGSEFPGEDSHSVSREMDGAETEDSISAGVLWDDEKMMELLGIVTDEDRDMKSLNEEESDTQGNEDQEVPSMLSALYDKINEPGSKILPQKCKLPGMKGNVVRMLNNKGNSLYQNEKYSIFEIQFSMKNVLHEYENVTEALLKVSVPDVRSQYRDAWLWMARNGILAIPRYRYDIYFANDETTRAIRSEIKKWKSSEDILPEKRNRSLRLKLGLGKPDVTKFHTPTYSLDSQKISLDIKSVVQKWSDVYFEKNKLAFGRGILVITIQTDSKVTRQCLKPLLSKPRLLLVSLDKRQCPIPPTSSSDDGEGSDEDEPIKRRKRDVEEQDKKKRRRRKGRGRKKSRVRITNPFIGPPRQDGDEYIRSHDSNRTRFIRRSHSRAVRSTICRRHPMYVSFDDVGWSQWIIAPRGYQAYRCAGECPFPLGGKLNGTNHAVLLTMMHSVEPWSTPQPCCVPTVLKPVSLLYFDTDGGVVLRQYEDMVVSTCGCR